MMRSIKYIFLLFTVICCCTDLMCQFDKIDNNLRDVVINKGDTSIYCSVVLNREKKDVDDKLTYYWYLNGTYGSNMGGYAGYLLHGEYTAFAGKNKLIEKGYYKQGLKQGKWKIWYLNGNLKETIKYRNGMKNGYNIIYNNKGLAVDSVYYKDDIVTVPFTVKNFFQGIITKKQDKTVNIKEKTDKPAKSPQKKKKIKETNEQSVVNETVLPTED